MHTLREKGVAAEAIPAGVPVFFDASNAYKLIPYNSVDYVAADLFAGISVAACGSGEFCQYAPPGADAVLTVAAGTGPWVGGQIVYFDQGTQGISTAVGANVDQAFARVKPLNDLDGVAVQTTAPAVPPAPAYIAVTVLDGTVLA